ncbi:MAG: hypothetical protein AVDCRST_MAG67-3546 [uncultured Solirubrobacteraceae bacterium]|uniref:SHOCT domain-containing protein n=1 Tax=uncultured Solirubrobacteraceae bacterium TaxID=1162706 RepID=A0A6J4TJ60_9ACTN|nr:MAG: hypothetical protein AVDCRST_MAG67-3546 [uncultured Solirubrobacteraceae bacterium]
MDSRKRSRRRLTWRVDDTATSAELAPGGAGALPPPAGGGRVVYVDENGLRRHLPADLAGLSAEQRDAAVGAMAQSLGAPARDVARTAAIERLTELRAAGRMSEEQYQRERRRLENY